MEKRHILYEYCRKKMFDGSYSGRNQDMVERNMVKGDIMEGNIVKGSILDRDISRERIL